MCPGSIQDLQAPVFVPYDIPLPDQMSRLIAVMGLVTEGGRSERARQARRHGPVIGVSVTRGHAAHRGRPDETHHRVKMLVRVFSGIQDKKGVPTDQVGIGSWSRHESRIVLSHAANAGR